MRYRIIYQKASLITEYRYCEYMMQVAAILRVWIPDISNCRIEVKGTDGEYHSETTSIRQVTSQTGKTHTVVEDRSALSPKNGGL